jgi:hypothetical protein
MRWAAIALMSIVMAIAARVAQADECDDAIDDYNIEIDIFELRQSEYQTSFDNAVTRAEKRTVNCNWARERAELLEERFPKARRVERLCGNRAMNGCMSDCLEGMRAEIRRDIEEVCSVPRSAPPPASPRPTEQQQSGLCACFALEQLPRSGSQYPFRAVNDCPVAVSYTYVECDSFGCQEKAGYMSANRADHKTGYSEKKEAKLVRVCGKGGNCCTPP